MLSPLAAQNPDLLRIIGAGQVTTKTQLAADLGREKGNLSKTLSKLEEEGLVSWPTLTERGKACLVAFDVAAGKLAVPAGTIVSRHGKIRKSTLNPRTDWDTPAAKEDLASLKASILQRGMRQNLQVRPTEVEDEFEIIDGERRWRAVGEAIQDGTLPADFPLICLVKEATDRQLMLDATDANVQRRDLSPIEEGRQFRDLRDKFEVPTLEISERIGKSQKYVQDRIRLTELDPILQARMSLPADDPQYLGMKEARGIFQKPKEEPKPKPLELSPKLAMALLELADKVENDPAGRGEPGFTRLAMRPAGGPLATLNDRKIVCLREYGGEVFAKILVHGSGAGTWLETQGFYGERRTEVLWMARTAIMKPEKASELTRDGKYIIPELNVEKATPAAYAEEIDTAAAPTRTPQEAVAALTPERFSEAVTDAALREAEASGESRPGAVCVKLSGKVTVEGEAWPEAATELLKTPWSGHPSAEVRLTVSDKGRWHACLSTQQGGPSYGGQRDATGVWTRDPIFPSREEALVYAAARIVKQLSEWATKRNIQGWLAELTNAAPVNLDMGADEANPVRPINPAVAFRSEIRDQVKRYEAHAQLEVGSLPAYRPSGSHAWEVADRAFRALYAGDVGRFLAVYARLEATVGSSLAHGEFIKTLARVGANWKTISHALDGDSLGFADAHRDCYGTVTKDEHGMAEISRDPLAPVEDDEDEAAA